MERERGRGRERERERETEREREEMDYIIAMLCEWTLAFVPPPLPQASQIAHLIRDYTHILVEKQKKLIRRSTGATATPTGGGVTATAAARRGRGKTGGQ